MINWKLRFIGLHFINIFMVFSCSLHLLLNEICNNKLSNELFWQNGYSISIMIFSPSLIIVIMCSKLQEIINLRNTAWKSSFEVTTSLYNSCIKLYSTGDITSCTTIITSYHNARRLIHVFSFFHMITWWLVNMHATCAWLRMHDQCPVYKLL